MLRKVFIVLDFEDEEQVKELQEELNNFSNSRVLDGHKLRTMLPMYQRHKQDIAELLQMVTGGGLRALLSARGAQLINNLRK